MPDPRAEVTGSVPTAIEMEFGRLLVRNGRSWLPLTEADIERGARAVVSDPHYRAEIARSAWRRSDEIGDAVLMAAICEAWDRLDERDGGDKKCHACTAVGRQSDHEECPF